MSPSKIVVNDPRLELTGLESNRVAFARDAQEL